MKDRSIGEILWTTLRSLDASTDPRKEAEPMMNLRRELVRTALELELNEKRRGQHNAKVAERPIPINAERPKKPDNPA